MLHWLSIANLFFSGLLAGEEVAMRFGIRGPLRRLGQDAHIELRQALIRTLRVLVPLVFALALGTGTAAAIVDLSGPTISLRTTGIVALLLFIGVTLAGTVPINQAVLTWSPTTAPDNWQTMIDRWERLDTIRTMLALIAFGLFLEASAP